MPNHDITRSPTADELMQREREDSLPVTRGEFREVRNAVMAMKAKMIGDDEYNPDPNSFVMVVKSHGERIASLEGERNKHRKITLAALTGAAGAAGAGVWAFLTAKH